ncbi:MAG: 3-hydroxyacyl-CoA dehydrogenase [Oceanospirillaceae bacterium]|nr:3-hydroxyacyl-CoA dehydrogenase [Oceanospirillaceae bacterium]
MHSFERITVIGAGTIGMSWAALFLASGRYVTLCDPDKNIESKTLTFIQNASSALQTLGWPKAGNTERLTFDADPVSAVKNTSFIQESIPERITLKHQLYRDIEAHLTTDAIVATSTSGLGLSQLQQGFTNPSRLILAHPFNPPHLIPLVELMGNQLTNMTALATAEHFYQSLGKQTIRLNKEIPGHIANRLQAALWRECIHLLKEGVASLEDIDKAVAHGPGLRWAALGPSSLFHLGGGEQGIEGFCKHIGPPMQTWWDDLGDAKFDSQTIESLRQGMTAINEKMSDEQLRHKRDTLIVDFLKSINSLKGV